MKKIFSVGFLIIIHLVIPKVDASTVGYLWENIVINIPVNDKLDDYINMPKCQVYVSDILQNTEVNYILDQTYFSPNTVVTTKVGTYYLDYVAIIPKYNHRSEQRVVFNVVDNIAPVITTSDQVILLEETIIFANHFRVTDNYDKESDIDVLVDERGFNNRQVGTYEIKITATDKSYNKSVAILNVEVKDEDHPSIIANDEVTEIPYGSPDINIVDYFTAVDNYDGDISSKIVLESNIDFYKLGEQEIILSVTDSSNLKYTYNGRITIVDIEKPRLELTEALHQIDNILVINDDYFRKFIFLASDNESKIGIDDVFIDYSQVQNRPGQYNVDYILTDNSNNETIITLILQVTRSLSVEADVIDIVIRRGETFDYNEFIDIKRIDGLEYYVVVENYFVDINKAGKYYIDIVITDSLNNSVSKKINVTVLEKEGIGNLFSNFGKTDIYIILAFILGAVYLFKDKKNSKK